MQHFEDVQKVLKDIYSPVIVNQVPKISPLYSFFEKKTAPFAGKQFIIPLQLTYTESVGARAAGDYTLPEAQKITYDQSYIKVKKIYGRVAIDGLAMKSSEGRGGWVDLMTNEIKGATNAFAVDLDRQLLCGGKGILGVVKNAIGTTPQNYVEIKNPGGNANDTDTNVTKFFRKGMVISFESAPTVKYTITDVNPSQERIVVSPDVSNLAANTNIYRHGVYSSTADDIGEIMGIDGIVSDGNAPGTLHFQGIDATACREWQSYVDSSTTTFSELAIQEALDAMELLSAGDPPSLVITTPFVRNKLLTVLQAKRMLDTVNYTAGWKAIKYVGGAVELPFFVHPKCPKGYVYFLSPNHIKLYTLLPLTWDDKNGGIIKGVAGSDSYEAWFKTYINLGTDCRNAHGKLTKITS